eukprot:6207651-Pleurochrysis_carterae.AAC.2
MQLLRCGARATNHLSLLTCALAQHHILVAKHLHIALECKYLSPSLAHAPTARRKSVQLRLQERGRPARHDRRHRRSVRGRSRFHDLTEQCLDLRRRAWPYLVLLTVRSQYERGAAIVLSGNLHPKAPSTTAARQHWNSLMNR